MKTILIPTDFTKIAHQAIDYALELFQNEKVQYILLNAFQVEPGPNQNSFEVEKANHQAKLNQEEEFLQRKINSDSIVKSILWLGKIDFLPEELLKENKVDLVVMGTEGINEVEKYLGKSHAGEFVSHVDVNTLVVPCCSKYSVPQNILFTTNYNNVKKEGSLDLLNEFINKFDSNVFVLYVNNTESGLTSHQEDVKKHLREYFNESKVSFHEFLAEDIEAEVENFMMEYNIDMVSAIPLHNTFFERIFHNSMAKKLAEHATKPVLILTNK